MPRNYTNGKSDKALIGHIGFDGPVKADTSQTKRILITGAGSYIGKSFIRYIIRDDDMVRVKLKNGTSVEIQLEIDRRYEGK